MEAPGMIATAQVGKTHGTDGWLRVRPFSGETEHLEKLRECEVATRDSKRVALVVSGTMEHSDSFLMRFRGYETREKAQRLAGGVLYVPRANAAKLEEGEYYIADLFGLKVVFSGREVGVVESVCDGAQAPYLLVRKSDGRTRYVPNMEPFVSKPDFARGEITLLMGEILDED